MQTNVFHWQFITFFRFLLALHLLYSGSAYIFFGWVPSAMADPLSPSGVFMAELDKIGLYSIVKYVEFFIGLLILGNRFVALAAAMELPITLVIFYLTIFVEGRLEHRHFYTGFQELLINATVLLGYGAYFRTILTMRARPRWLWQALPPGRDALPGKMEDGALSGAWGTPQIWIFYLLFMAAIMTASWILGPVDRRLPPRDWLPPLLAFIAMLVAWRTTRPAPPQAGA